MREIPREGNSPRFILKAIGEAGSELADELYAVRRRDADRRGDDGYSFRQIAAHLRDHEEMVLSYVERILSRREPRLEAIDSERALDDASLVDDEIDQLLSEFGYLRRQTQFQLWDLPPGAWERRGIHVYRGPVTVIQLARELHLHDLQYLWRVRRMREELTTRR